METSFFRPQVEKMLEPTRCIIGHFWLQMFHLVLTIPRRRAAEADRKAVQTLSMQKVYGNAGNDVLLEVKAAVGAIGNLVQEQLQMKCARLKCQVRLREGR